jgi:hypothetical protein
MRRAAVSRLIAPYRQRCEAFPLGKNWGFAILEDMKKARFPLNQLNTLQSERNLAHERQDVENSAAAREATKSVKTLP